jgi:hypothetical protein
MKDLDVTHFASSVELAEKAAKDWLSLILSFPVVYLVAIPREEARRRGRRVRP